MSLRKSVVILGGGVGALTTAYYLTSKPGWQQEYEITVYQLGWRLGGKGASSRNPDPKRGLRIEEHGLHVWFGFYENAFSLMRACYRELDRPWEEAFKHQDDIYLMEDVKGEWSSWQVPFPKLPGEPGEDNAEHSPWDVLMSLVNFVREYVDEWLRSVPPHRHVRPATIPQAAMRSLAHAERSALATSLHVAFDLMHALHPDPARHEPNLHGIIVNWLREFRQWVEKEVGELLDRDQALRRLWCVVDLGLSAAIGILADDLLVKGLRSIDDRDFGAWLCEHGATKASLASSPLRALYDCCFAYEDGDLEQPNFAAGAALGCALRIALMYRGHVLYEMRAGMGDIVVAPLYELLAERGVKFEFFQRVKRLELSPDRRSIARIHFGKQVTLKNGGYEPLGASGKLRYWPKTPRYEQIEEGARLEQENIDLESHWTPWKDVKDWALDVGEQDRVVLGISLGGLASICEELCTAKEDWKNLVDKLPSMQTQSVQLWLTGNLQRLGWQGPPPAMVAAPEPLDVWADMSHLIGAERWPPGNSPRSIQYFCGPMPGNLLSRPPSDLAVPKEAWQAVRKQAIDWFGRYTGWLWRDAVAPPGSKTLDWTLLFGSQAKGEERIDSQWLHANINPTERYVLSPVKFNAYRLPADESGFDNLVLAGDWTRTAINAGCVEAAVMSGMAASRAVCGHPETIHGEHFMEADA
jgi:uncharacterized protein with NAD-binding domain and iron-sulfur cluster